jgi:diacylglycerol kinase family enzyme
VTIPGSFLPTGARDVVIAVNPKAGATAVKARVARLAELLTEKGLVAAVLTNLDEVATQSNCLHEQGRLRTLIGVGGDGTAAELVNRTLPGVPLTIFPAGNENLVARHFGLGSSPEECAKTVVEGAVLRCDAGRANDRIFLVMCSCGFDADVVHTVHVQRTGHVNNASYFNPIVDTIRHYDYPELHIYWEDDGEGALAGGGKGESPIFADTKIGTVPKTATDNVVRWLFAFNMPCYGGGLQIAPQADATDGLLDVCTFRHGGLWHGLYYTAAVLTGTHRRLTDFATRRSGAIRVTADAKVPFQLDGDPGGFLPVNIAIMPKRLTLVVPKEKALL